LFGRTDANAELVAYGESWSRKIEMNPAAFDLVRNAVKPPHLDAIVTVAVRSNGSVETVTFVRSSGVPAVDEAIRRVVQSQENYPAFPPALLRDYDVVEIRRTWHFDTAIRLN
jgi:TonB family protein